jgi:hypothetical protein
MMIWVLYENMDTHTPMAQTLDAASNLRTQDRMRSLASEPRLRIPGHDPAVFGGGQTTRWSTKSPALAVRRVGL